MFRKTSITLLAVTSLVFACREDGLIAERFIGAQSDASAEKKPVENPVASVADDAESDSNADTQPTLAVANDTAISQQEVPPAESPEQEAPPAGSPDQEVPQVPSGSFLPSITAITVTNSKGDAPRKGDALKITFSLKNDSPSAGEVTVFSNLSGLRFTDFNNVPLTDVKVKLEANSSHDVTFEVPVFLEDTAKKSRFALGRGNYELKTKLSYGSEVKASPKSTNFEIAEGKGVFALAMYDEKYFEVGDAKGADPEAWLKETFTRKGSIFYPESGTKQIFAGGFDEMMGIEHHIKAVGGLDSRNTKGVDIFDNPEAFATEYLNLNQKWAHGSGPSTNKHGYDYFIALDKDSFGGVTFGTAQVTGAGISGDFSKDRMQMLIVHESGHVFGSPHCDPIQGFIMCSGEKNKAYKADGEYIWHEDSFKKMKNLFK